MVRVRRRHSSVRPSIPIQNPGVRRRSILRESLEQATRDSPSSSNTEPTIEFNQTNENITIPPIENPPTPFIVPEILPDYEESEQEEAEHVRTVHDDHVNSFFLEGNVEQLSVSIPLEAFLTWELEAEIRRNPSTQDKQTQCPETTLTPRYSLETSREYSPVFSSHPRWYLLPEEDPEQLLNTFCGVDEVDS